MKKLLNQIIIFLPLIRPIFKTLLNDFARIILKYRTSKKMENQEKNLILNITHVANTEQKQTVHITMQSCSTLTINLLITYKIYGDMDTYKSTLATSQQYPTPSDT